MAYVSIAEFCKKRFANKKEREKSKFRIYQKIYTGKLEKGKDWDEKIETRKVKIINENYKP